MKKAVFCIALAVSLTVAFVSCGTSHDATETERFSLREEPTQEASETSPPHPSEETRREYAYTTFSEAERGETVSVTLSGCMPGERAVCRAKYTSGWSDAKGLGLGIADADGLIVWTWAVGASVKTGEEAEVFLINADGEVIGSFPFTVTEKQTETDPDGTETDTADEPESGTEPVIRYRVEQAAEGMTVTVFDEAERGSTVTVRLCGATPGSTYSCTMTCKSGPSDAEGLGDAVADEDGEVVWEWRIGARLSLDFQPTVCITGPGLEDGFSFSFTVLE